MSVFRITDDGKDGRSGELMNHARFEGDAEDEELFWNGRGGVAMTGHDAELDEDDLLDVEDVERGLNARHHQNGSCERGYEGFDQQVHFWPGSTSKTARDIIM